MIRIKKFALVLAAGLTLSAGAAQAAGGGIEWDKFPMERATDLSALQNGARLFVNNCLNCHAAQYVRYNRLRDIGLTEQQIVDNLIFTDAKVGDLMRVNLDPKEAKDWYGKNPPDLTLIARSRAAMGKGSDSGADYLYTLLRTYYRDDTRNTGWNNLAYPGIGMPHVLWQLQGQQRAVYNETVDPDDPSKVTKEFVRFEQITPGTMSPAEYNEAMADLVAFLYWMSEPNRFDRKQLGVWVLLFLAVFTVIAWRLNAAFWKDIK